jgi:hypothetical protein
MPLIGASKYFSGFSPQSIPGCSLWLDAADSNVMTLSGSNVTAWRDKSGNGYNFTVHPSHTSPTYSSNAINGLNSLFFQGAGSGGTRYNILYNTSIPVNGPAFSIFTVVRRNATAPSSTGGNYILTDNANSRLLYITYTSNFLLTSTANSTSGWNDITVNTPGQTLLATSISGMVVSGSVLTPYVNGTAQNTKGGTTTSFTGLSIGDVLNANESGQTWTGFISEILLYNVAVTTPQRQQIEGYLANKWGLKANIPTTHPFKSLTPFGRPFIPVDISQCLLWLDGSEPSSLSLSGSNVTTWRDKSGNAKNLTPGSFSSPTYASNGVTFTGNAGLTFSGGLSSFYDIFVIATPLASTASWRTLMQVAGGTATHTILVETGSIRLGTWFNGFSQFGSLTWGASNALLFARLNSNLTMNASMNGTVALTAPTAAVGAATSSTINIGNAPGTQPWGTLYEFIVYDGALTLGQRQLVETYLVNKWGLRGLTPSNHPTRLIAPLSGAFSPLVLSNCGMWLDAADATSLTLSGTNVVRWNDKSGNTRHAVSTGNPQLGTMTTGRPAIVLSGTNYFDVSGASTLSGGAMTIFAQASATTNSRNLLAIWGNTRVITFQLYYNGNIIFFTSNTLFFNSNAMCCIIENPATTVCSSFFNGRTDNTTTAASFTPTSQFVLGANWNYSNGWIGNIQEVIIYNRALPAAERQQVEGYLAGKWGLMPTLVAGHPYKSATP